MNWINLVYICFLTSFQEPCYNSLGRCMTASGRWCYQFYEKSRRGKILRDDSVLEPDKGDDALLVPNSNGAEKVATLPCATAGMSWHFMPCNPWEALTWVIWFRL